MCATWQRRPAGHNNNFPILHNKAVPEPLWCAELECYCVTSWPARPSCAQNQLRTVLKKERVALCPKAEEMWQNRNECFIRNHRNLPAHRYTVPCTQQAVQQLIIHHWSWVNNCWMFWIDFLLGVVQILQFLWFWIKHTLCFHHILLNFWYSRPFGFRDVLCKEYSWTSVIRPPVIWISLLSGCDLAVYTVCLSLISIWNLSQN